MASDMMSQASFFHADVQGLHFLFQSFEISSPFALGAAFFCIALICWTERACTYLLDVSHADILFNKFSRSQQVLYRTGLYTIATILRLFYMLVTMSFHIGLFVMVVLALASGQLVVEYARAISLERRSQAVLWEQRTSSTCNATDDDAHALLELQHDGKQIGIQRE
ncbi:uncharacterized protein VTP21DRAFT_8350 [Calcarisporiella thermophila]|uniref:uncharacterized protein n=1 Tax=Calcarisporiella thermophila TaxID=911321 RepID=UPI003743B03B